MLQIIAEVELDKLAYSMTARTLEEKQRGGER